MSSEKLSLAFLTDEWMEEKEKHLAQREQLQLGPEQRIKKSESLRKMENQLRQKEKEKDAQHTSGDTALERGVQLKTQMLC